MTRESHGVKPARLGTSRGVLVQSRNHLFETGHPVVIVEGGLQPLAEPHDRSLWSRLRTVLSVCNHLQADELRLNRHFVIQPLVLVLFDTVFQSLRYLSIDAQDAVVGGFV